MELNEIMFKKLTTDDKAAIIQYAKEKWIKYNKQFFGNKLKYGGIYIQKDTGKDFRQLGVYRGRNNEIGLNRRLVLAGEQIFNDVLKHEMCHQATILIDKSYKDHHGPVWAKWMRKCKLKPDRLSTDPKHVFLTDTEKKIEKKKKVERQRELEKVTEKKKLYPAQLQKYAPAKYLDSKTNTWVIGLIACPHDQARKRWALVNSPFSTGWKIVPNDWFYELTPTELKKVSGNEWKDKANKICDYYERKSGIRKEKSTMRKLGRSLWGF